MAKPKLAIQNLVAVAVAIFNAASKESNPYVHCEWGVVLRYLYVIAECKCAFFFLNQVNVPSFMGRGKKVTQ